jgi:hypothetical protein
VTPQANRAAADAAGLPTNGGAVAGKQLLGA